MPGTNSPPELDAGKIDLEPERPNDVELIEQAEAEAAEAEALADAARARVRAIRLRQQAEAIEIAALGPPEAGAVVADSVHIGAEHELACAAAIAVDTELADAGESRAEESGGPGERKRKVPRLRRPKRTTVAVGIGILCTAALFATSAVMLQHHENALRKQQRAAEFTAAARQVVVTLMSINAASAKDDVQHIVDSSTGQFRDDFKAAAEDFIKAAQSAKVSTKTSVQAAAVESMTNDTAVVLVAASSTLTNTAGVSEQPRSWRLSVKLARDGGQIKMSSMEFIP